MCTFLSLSTLVAGHPHTTQTKNRLEREEQEKWPPRPLASVCLGGEGGGGNQRIQRERERVGERERERERETFIFFQKIGQFFFHLNKYPACRYCPRKGRRARPGPLKNAPGLIAVIFFCGPLCERSLIILAPSELFFSIQLSHVFLHNESWHRPKIGCLKSVLLSINLFFHLLFMSQQDKIVTFIMEKKTARCLHGASSALLESYSVWFHLSLPPPLPSTPGGICVEQKPK